MTRRFLYYLILITLVLPAAFTVQAQRHFGIIWDPPANEADAARELFHYQQIGIRTLMIEGIHDLGLLDVLHGFDFDVYVNVDQPYLTATRLGANLSAVQDRMIRHIDYYRTHEFIQSYIIFNDGQVNSTRFTRKMGSAIEEVRSISNLPLHYISGNPEHQFHESHRPDGILIRIFDSETFPDLGQPAGETASSEPIPVSGFIWTAETGFDIRTFQEMMQRTEPFGDVPLFLHKIWVSDHLQYGLDEVLIAYAGDSDAVFPNPRPTASDPAFNWHIILLILIWISFTLHYAFFPTYKKSLIRYFTHHQFFIEDIFERRIRFSSTLLYIHLQTSLIFGLFFHSLYYFYLNTTGVDVLRYYHLLPDLIHPSVFLFMAGVIFKMIIDTLFTMWVFAPSLDTHLFNPAAITYVWPQQLLLPVITIMITVNMAGAPPVFFNTLAVFFLLIWISSFYIAVINIRRYVEKKTLYDGLSWGLQIPLAGILCWWIFIELGLWDILQLAAFVN